ncbi:beta-lactamase class B [Amycolatopsis mediterranei S699]|uniref:Beta-lactamase class B n=2 Tax=Amycolatopsis mediterranei TaxID=33910 RepID=A0A0H3CUA7_AMYMU|nr:MBL fold metallo-hydrolase [Amycolatopsis mediterranei]ADJ42217.1 beta-lactamase class B [Amycolatopsis mediterranei U32]AEK38897.1 beta-lactamase class B [Amycolatopsis mediterranei S699]AFO73931.1 beta-lactamase class B [Amycolatopsis mediterranei S699]AGT81060.1 beta-lactamase class B [Amycolatopsis mediterranei RB]KDO06152.1 beta-lactamase [Amycolatopsis mediterranei]
MTDRSPAAAAVTRLADRVHGYVQPDGSWYINNCGFVDAGDHTVLIDTCSTERRTRALLETVEAATGSPVTTLVNTHHHGDHTNGNYLVGGATIIGHRKTRELMVAEGIQTFDGIFVGNDWGELESRPPEVVFDDRLTVHAGDVTLELIHPGHAAHTTNDVLVWLPEQRVLYAGDLVFNGGSPFALMGSVAGWRKGLDVIRELSPEVILPGHGGPCGLDVVDTVDRYLAFVQKTAERGKAAGLSPLEVAKETDLGEFASLSEQERLPGNLHRAYAELDGAEWGADIDLVAAITDMLAINRGPIRCFS